MRTLDDVQSPDGAVPDSQSGAKRTHEVGESVPGIVARAFAVVDSQGRVRLLSRLLRAVGPLALAVIGGGTFFRFVWQARPVTLEDAAGVSSSQVYELASYVQQSNPEVVEQVLTFLVQDVTTIAALGVSTVALAISMTRRARERR
jgi:hypothetical protein